MSVPHAAGALYSTTGDLLRWEQGLFGGKVVSPASLVKMTTPFKNDYALGIVVQTSKGQKVIQHAGGIGGFTVFFFKVLEATLEFQQDANSAAAAVRLRQGPINALAPRK